MLKGYILREIEEKEKNLPRYLHQHKNRAIHNKHKTNENFTDNKICMNRISIIAKSAQESDEKNEFLHAKAHGMNMATEKKPKQIKTFTLIGLSVNSTDICTHI